MAVILEKSQFKNTTIEGVKKVMDERTGLMLLAKLETLWGTILGMRTLLNADEETKALCRFQGTAYDEIVSVIEELVEDHQSLDSAIRKISKQEDF